MQEILWILFYAGRILSLVMTQFVKQMKIVDTDTSGNRVPCDRYLTRICNSQFLTSNQRGGGGKVTLLFPPKFLDPLRLPVWRHIVTGKNLGSLVQISKGNYSYLDERGQGKAKKLANIAICRLFHRMCVSFGVAIICFCKPYWYFVSVIV